jgi:hypothetical protein
MLGTNFCAQDRPPTPVDAVHPDLPELPEALSLQIVIVKTVALI